MLFLDRPAEKPEELFDREEELEQLRRAVESRRLTLVVGMRRVGKTSVVKAGTYGMARIYIDARAFEERPYISYGDCWRLCVESCGVFCRFTGDWGSFWLG